MTEISIIVAVYNVEDSVSRSINSILNQKKNSLELILVNDGSTDRSGEICDEFALQDSRIKVVHKENGGLASARNAGLNIAEGEFLFFMDSDDWIEENLVNDNLKLIKNSNADVLLFGFVKEITLKSGGKNEMLTIPPKWMPEYNENLEEHLVNIFTSGCGFSIWNQLIRKDFLKQYGLKFPGFKRGSDMFFLFELYSKKPRIATCQVPYYHYIAYFSQSKFNPESLQNHVVYFDRFNNIFPGWTKSGEARAFSVRLFLLWFSHVIPTGIVLSNSFSFKEKIKLIEQIFLNEKVEKWIREFRLNEGGNKLSYFLFLIFKTRSPILQYIFTKVKIQAKKRASFNYKRLIYQTKSI